MKITQAILSAFICLFAAGCGGGGSAEAGSGTNAAVDTSPTPAPADTSTPSGSSKLFAADSTNLAIGSVVNANFTAGTFAVDRLIQGSGTKLSSLVNGMAIDPVADRLYVTQDTQILVFDNAGLTNGNAIPRVLASSGSAHYVSPFLDRANDRLYVVDPHAKSVFVFDNASTAVNAFPARTLSFPDGFVNGLAVDTTRNLLYTRINGSLCRIAVVANADTANGIVTPVRYIDFCSVNRLLIDPAKDRLYVATHMGSVVMVDSASTLNGTVTGTSMSLAISGSVTDIALDGPNDRFYALVSNKIYQINNISSWNGSGTAFAATIPDAGLLAAIAVKQ
jgi:hypothetical protein